MFSNHFLNDLRHRSVVCQDLSILAFLKQNETLDSTNDLFIIAVIKGSMYCRTFSTMLWAVGKVHTTFMETSGWYHVPHLE